MAFGDVTSPVFVGRDAELAALTGAIADAGAGNASVVLVVEDIHWADQSTIELLAFLVRTLHAVPVCLVMTYRSDELHRRHPLRPFLRGWERDAAVRSIQLRGFTDVEVAAQAAAILG